jgi:hypothetical protein
VTVAVCDTGFAVTEITPGRRLRTASVTAFEDAQCTPDTSITAVVAELVITGPLPSRSEIHLSERCHSAATLYPWGVSVDKCDAAGTLGAAGELPTTRQSINTSDRPAGAHLPIDIAQRYR